MSEVNPYYEAFSKLNEDELWLLEEVRLTGGFPSIEDMSTRTAEANWSGLWTDPSALLFQCLHLHPWALSYNPMYHGVHLTPQGEALLSLNLRLNELRNAEEAGLG